MHGTNSKHAAVSCHGLGQAQKRRRRALPQSCPWKPASWEGPKAAARPARKLGERGPHARAGGPGSLACPLPARVVASCSAPHPPPWLAQDAASRRQARQQALAALGAARGGLGGAPAAPLPRPWLCQQRCKRCAPCRPCWLPCGQRRAKLGEGRLASAAAAPGASRRSLAAREGRRARGKQSSSQQLASAWLGHGGS